MRLLLLLFFTSCIHGSDLELVTHKDTNYLWKYTLPLDAHDLFYADYFDVSIDHPSIVLNTWSIDQQPTQQYDTTFKQTKKIIEQPVTIRIDTSIETFPTNAHMHVTYYRKSEQTIAQKMIALPNPKPVSNDSTVEKKQYSLIKKQPDFYTPSPIVLTVTLIAILLIAYHCLIRKRSMYAIVLIASSVFIAFQLMKSIVINKKNLHTGGYRLHSHQRPHMALFGGKK